MDFSTLLDNVLETGASVATKLFERDIKQSEAKSQEALRAAEEARLKQLELYQAYGVSDDYSSVTIAGVTVPTWVLPVVLGVGAFLIIKKVK